MEPAEEITKESAQTPKSESGQHEKEAQDPSVFYRSEYAKKEFWNSRFEKQKGFFDWYVEYNELKAYFKKIYPIKPTHKILMVGCGNSRLSEDMYDDGFKDIVNIDISDVVVNKMNEYILKKNKNMTFIEMDATKMEFEKESFDVVIDKGTLDAVLCGKDISVGVKLLSEMSRVCKQDGFMLVITYGGPILRKRIFKASLGSEFYQYSYCQQNLSSMVQLINIMRNNLGSKPLRSILKDKDALKNSLLEYAKCSKAEKKSIVAQSLNLEESLPGEKGNSDIQNNIEMNGAEDEDEEEEEEEEGEKIVSKSTEEGTNEKVVKSSEESNNENTADTTEEESKEDKSTEAEIFKPKRQEFCYIYKIWRKI